MKRLLCVFLLVLGGCSWLNIKTEPVETPKLEIKMPDPLKLGDITFLIVKRDNVEQKFKELEKKKLLPVIFGMSGQDYKVLAVNMQQLQNYIQLLQEIIKQYKDYYEGPDVPPAGFYSHR